MKNIKMGFEQIKNRIRGIRSNIRRRKYELYDKQGPEYATIVIGEKCTNSCIFCPYHCREANGLFETLKGDYSLTFDEFREIVDILSANNIQAIHICSCGEPFLHKDILEFIDYGNKKSRSVSFQTNFRKPFRNHVDEISKRKISYITTDIVGGDRSSFEKIKKGSRWNELWENIDYLNKKCNKNNNDIPVQVCCIVNKQRITYENLHMLVDKCGRYENVKKIFFKNVYPFGFNEFVSPENVISVQDKDIIKHIGEVIDYAKERDITAYPPLYHDPGNTTTCKHPWNRIMVNHPNKKLPVDKWKGNIMAGGCMATMVGDFYSIGNIFHQDFSTIWNSEKMMSARNRSLRGEYIDKQCKSCPEKMN